MDNRPTPKPRKQPNNYENVKRPVPLPRIKENPGGPNSPDDSRYEIILRTKPSDEESQKTGKTVKIVNQNARHTQLTNKVSERKNFFNNHFSKKNKDNNSVLNVPHQERCVSLPVTDTKLFDSIQFTSPIDEQYHNTNLRPHQSLSSESFTNSSDRSNLSELNVYNVTLSLLEKEFDSSDSSLCLKSDSTPMTNSPNNSQPSEQLSASWSLYDTVNSSDCEENASKKLDTVHDNLVKVRKSNNDPIKITRPSQSVMIEFDPLSKIENLPFNESGSINLLKSLSNNDHVRNSATTDVDPELDFYWNDSVEYLSPPTPPERLDSLFLNKDAPDEKTNKVEKRVKTQDPQSKWFVNNDGKSLEEEGDTSKSSNIASRFSSIFKKVPESASYIRKLIDSNTTNTIPSKLMTSTNTACHQGKMVRFLPGGIEEILKKYSMRPCSLADYKLVFYQENSNVKDIYHMKNFYSVQIILSHKFNYDSELHCFQMNLSSLGTTWMNRGSIIFGCENEGERNMWIRKIVENFTTSFPSSYVTHLTRFGWCYLKEGVSGTWDVAWILLSKRKLFYYTSQDSNIKIMDLRKSRCIVLKESNEKKVGEIGFHILLDQQDVTLYLKMGADRETKLWHHIIKAVATNNGSSIHHQQLTKDDIPTIVDKCINFIYTQGSLSVGIYRKAGSNGLVSQLIADFRADAWAVQLASRTHSEYDVATALKRFFRDLPDSLLTAELYPMFCAIAEISNTEEKVKKYKSLIEQLDIITQNTLKKLLGHLHFIQSLADENCMTSMNLATVWGPTLLSSPLSNTSMTQEGSKVVYDLIELYMMIYEPSKSDIEREQKMLSVLKQCQKVTNPILKRSGDLHVWIYLFEKSSGNPVNVVLNPGRTSGNVCLELCSKISKEYHLYMIEEVICGGSLRRPIHHDESLLDVVLRWGYWDEKDRCDNYLILKDNNILIEAKNKIEQEKTMNINMELRFANAKTKSFAPCTIDLKDGILTCSKDKNTQNQSESWSLTNLRWYLGHELKRNPQSKWSITFIEKNKTLRTKEKPWFGSTFAGVTKDELNLWIGALFKTEYSDLLPEPRLIVM